ncbi:MAG: hypothetical protein AB2L12_09375 [Smithellaceae bacterium]
MIDDFKKSIQITINEKIASPFSGTFFFTWFVWNWRMLYYLIFPDDTLTLEKKLDFVSLHFINWNYNLLYPFFSAIFLIVAYPVITTSALWVSLRYKKLQTDLKNKIEGSKLLTLEQSINIRQQLQETEEKYAKILLTKDEELKNRQIEVGLLTDSLKKEENAKETANQKVAAKDEELKEKLREIDKLTKELNDVTRGPKLTPKETIRTTNNITESDIKEDLLNLPLSDATLQEYTKNKFRGLAVSTDLQKIILRDINISDYPTIRNIDNTVNRATPALVAYQLESPKMFKWGTDYISKALGFMDDNFRAKHGFSNETRIAFTRYGSLVKQPNGKIEPKSEKIPINDLWELNHWHSNCASIVGDKIIFSGIASQNGEDGSNINLYNKLEVGSTYEISCFARSKPNTTAMFRLWCHDKTGATPYGVNITTDFKTPSTEGEIIKLNFKAEFNKNIRIHLQYKTGQGAIEISDVRISELKI